MPHFFLIFFHFWTIFFSAYLFPKSFLFRVFPNKTFQPPTPLSDRERTKEMAKVSDGRSSSDDLYSLSGEISDDDKSIAEESLIRHDNLTESLIRGDVVAPHVIQFTPTYQRKKRKRHYQLGGFAFVVALSLFGFFRLRRMVFSFSHEALLDIETRMNTTEKATSEGGR